jgi:pimeloyl-ACP methyl ester carboxylesterase
VFYTAILEEIASHGYVVIALTHPYSTDAVAFSNGRVINLNGNGTRLLSVLSSDPEYGEQVGDHTVDVWASDALFVLDQLHGLNSEDALLGGHLDLEHIGMFGHSFGGATAAEAAYRDDRILAVINMDGAFFGSVDDDGLGQPFMFMASDRSWPACDADRFGMSQADWDAKVADVFADLAVVRAHASRSYVFTLAESGHGTFGDVSLLAALNVDARCFQPANVGRIDAAHAHAIITTYIEAFFDKHVRGLDVPLLDGPSIDYPEVTLEIDA